MISAVNEDEARWKRQDDARTLARAEEIKADKKRYKEAIRGANEIYSKELDRVKGIKKIATKQAVVKSNPATLGKL